MTSLCCNRALTTGKKKLTINYKHWFAIWYFQTTKIRTFDVSSNIKIFAKTLVPQNFDQLVLH